MGKKTKGTETRKASQSHAEEPPVSESLDLSCIERASILDGGPHKNYGNPLHSTAMEEDLGVPEEDAKARGKVEKKGGGGLGKATPAAVAKQRQVASPRKREDAGGASPRKSVGEKRAAGPEMHQGVDKENKRGRTLANRKSSSSQTPSPSPKRARKSSSSRSADHQRGQRKLARKSSSSDSGAVPPVTQTDGQRGRPRGHRGAESSVVLDSFLALLHTYNLTQQPQSLISLTGESVESTAVRHTIDTFSSTVKEQLTEMITMSKELRVLKRDNAKVDSLIKRKRHRLLEAKYELVRAKQELRSLQKEDVVLGQRLVNLKRGRSFLHGIRDLNTRYLAHRRAHPTEKEQYGSPSLPALLLETKSVLRAEDHLRKINDRLEARMNKNKQT